MEENKNLNNNPQNSEAKPQKAPKQRSAKIKNQAIWKRGSYSLAITAIFIAAAIVLNVLVGILADRVSLEFDMTTDKINSVNKENVKFIKNIEKDVDIIFCGDPESYVGGYMAYYAQQYGVNDNNANDYYAQTVKLVEKYGDYNKKLKVQFIDSQDTAFAAISAKYPNETINYGDIIVSYEKGENERHKILRYTDIYEVKEDQSYASYGYTVKTVAGNQIETALTSAISYVTGTDTKKIAFLTGHSTDDYTEDYKKLLGANNYEITVIEDAIVTEISNEFDAVVIAAPVTDFIGAELDVISAFLDNEGNLGKGLMFFANIKAPYLTNLYDFLAQWGITVGEGILYETDTRNQYSERPTVLGSYSSDSDQITSSLNYCLTGNNVPLSAEFEEQGNIVVTPLVITPKSVVAAPVGTQDGWTGADNYTKNSYSTIIGAIKEDYDKENNTIYSYVTAFSSVEFIYSEFTEFASVSNEEITLALSERSVSAEDTGIYFTTKTITNESFSDKVTKSSTNTVTTIFMVILPLAMIAAGIYVYIKRRNA